MSRSMSFLVEDVVDTRITITEIEDGSLFFELETLESGSLGDLRALFFDLADVDGAVPIDLSALEVSSTDSVISSAQFKEGAVSKLQGKDANIAGKVKKTFGAFDAGIEFGTPGKSKDDIHQASFFLTNSMYSLSLDMLDLTDFALRYTSVGLEGERNDSLKTGDQSSGVARNDVFEVDENDSNTINVLANDTSGASNTVTRVFDADGDFETIFNGFKRQVFADGAMQGQSLLDLGILTVTSTGLTSFVANGVDVDKLALGEKKVINFEYTTTADDGTSYATAGVTFTVWGVNDQPIAEDLFFAANEDNISITGNFSASDVDVTDVLQYEILSQPVDEFGHQYGTVVNGNDGSFTFLPGDQFQFLEEGETRDVTFQYVAIDDSGAENAVSEVQTITVSVEGAYDAPVDTLQDLLFVTENQSMFGTGSAIVFDDPLPFFGIDEYASLNTTIIQSQTFGGDVLEGIFDGIEAVAQLFADAGCTIAGWFGSDCEADVDLPSSITTPSVGTSGYVDAKIGLQPYFELTTGEVDSTLPVDIVFTAPYQVEEGDTFTISSAYSVDNGASFQTMSPNVSFGMDFVFDLDVDFNLALGSADYDVLTFDTGDIADFKGVLGDPGFNIFDFSAEDDLETSIDLGGYGTLDLNFPVIETDSNDEANPASDVLTSNGEDDIAVLDLDVDSIISALPYVPPLGDSYSAGATVNVAGESLNLLSVNLDWDLVAVNLISSLNVIQDFELTVEELPLVAIFEDGTEITGLSVGDDIVVTAPETSAFDVDIDGDADGLLDFQIDVDMEAIFNNLSTLGFDMELFVGLMRVTGGITSDFFNGPSFSLFPGGDAGTEDDFLWSETLPLAEDIVLATLYDDSFELQGFEENIQTVGVVTGSYDIA